MGAPRDPSARARKLRKPQSRHTAARIPVEAPRPSASATPDDETAEMRAARPTRGRARGDGYAVAATAVAAA